MERCPNCRARGEDTATCRRCGMDLSHLSAVEQAAKHLTARGVMHLAAGDPVAASGALHRVLDLRHTPFARLLLGFTEALAAQASPSGTRAIEHELRALMTSPPQPIP